MPRAYVALGSNLGDRHAYLALARDRLARLPGTVLLGVSPIDETEPLGGLDQPPYLNQMVALETTLAPRALLEACQRERWASRTLDLDLVRFGDVVMDEPGLTLPHPGLGQRSFWREELAALAGQGW
jgi:2-amino-4-hydroxy-6-hydroxymethyldihydropteridine diphosphokinase